jgi:hypothetical protein
MLKKLLIPAFAFTVAVVGCSSSSTPSKDGGAGSTGTAGSTAGSTGTAGSTAGTTGTAGATAGTTGTAGATAGSTGTAGATAGTTGTAGTDGGAAGSAAGHDGGAAGTDGGAAGTDGGGAAGSDGGTVIPACTSTSDTSTAMTAETFCKIFLADCGTTHAGYATMTDCMSAYTASAALPKRHMCISYHLCNAASMTGEGRAAHCGHASTPGTAPCAQTE